jgi:hypothetical protein
MVQDDIKMIAEQSNLLTEKLSEWHHRLLVAASALFGILISLHTTSQVCPLARLTFAAAIVSLALGILLTAYSLYREIDAIRRARKAYVEESVAALREGRATDPVVARERKRFVFCAKASYTCFAFSVLLLALYAVLIALS